MLISDEPNTRLVVLMFTDLAGSVDLKTRLGAATYAKILSTHDQHFKDIMASIPGAVTIKDTGDGFLAKFETTSDAVRAALRFQHVLHHEKWDPEPARVRIGLHIGQVSELDKEVATGLPKIVGLAADIAARIMDLAVPGQILMSRTLFDDARQYIREHPPVNGGNAPEMKWLAHGPYLFKGADAPMDVFEVGAVGIAPLKEPPDSNKARRAVRPGEEELLGWRPAIGLEVPSREGWKLEKKLGEGGFGEVWLARHHRTKESRVFKFCYDPDRLRSFKREMTLFRLLREALGAREDIVRLYEVRLDQPPFFLESAYSEEGDMKDWAARQGGIDKIPMATRIELVAAIADALSAAHSVGVLHKDVKPANVLIRMEIGQPRPVLADFGIGMIGDISQLEARNITMTGFTETMMDNESSRTGTRLYAPPELMTGKPFTVQGDIYSLGVLLYQMVVGDLSRPLAHGWEAQIEDPILREDIAAAVAGNVEQRLKSASELSQRLRRLDSRRAEQRRQKRARTTRLAVGVLAALLALSTTLILYERSLRREATDQRDLANKLKGEAESAQKKAETAQRQAEEHFRLSQDRLERFQLEKAAQLVSHDLPRATLWFAEAMKTDQASAAPDPTHRLRLAVAMGQTPSLHHVEHFGMFQSSNVSSDGRYVFTRPWGKDATLYDLTTLERTTVPMRDPGSIVEAMLTGDASRIMLRRKDNLFELVSAKDGSAIVDPVPMQGTFSLYDASDDGGRIITRDAQSRIILLDGHTGKSVGEPIDARFEYWPRLSPDGRYLIAQSYGGRGQLLNAQTGEPAADLTLPPGLASQFAFNADSTRLFFVESGSTIHLFDMTNHKALIQPLTLRYPVVRAEFSRDGRHLLVISDRTMLLDARTGKSVPLRLIGYRQHEVNRYTATTLDNDARLIGSIDGAGSVGSIVLNLRDFRDGVPLYASLRHDASIRSIHFFDGKVITLTFNGLLRIWDISRVAQPSAHMSHFAAAPPAALPGVREGPVRSRVRPPDADDAAPEDSKPDIPRRPGDIRDELGVFDPLPGNPAPTPNDPIPSPFPLFGPSPPGPNPAVITEMTLMPDGATLMTGSQDKTVRLWDVATGRQLHALRHSGMVSDMELSPDGKRLLVTGNDRSVTLWDLTPAEPGSTTLAVRADKVVSARFSSKGDRIALVSEAGHVRVLNANDLKAPPSELKHTLPRFAYFTADDRLLLVLGALEMKLYDWRTGEPASDAVQVVNWVRAEWSPDRKRFALVGQEGTVKVFDGSTCKPIGQPLEHDATINTIRFDPTGNRLATAGQRGLRIWDVNTSRPLTGVCEQERIVGITFDQTGALAASCDEYGAAVIWNAATGELIARLHPHPWACQFVAFTPGNTHLIVASSEDVFVWPMPNQDKSLEEITLTAQVNAGAKIDVTGSVEFLPPEELIEMHRALRAMNR